MQSKKPFLALILFSSLPLLVACPGLKITGNTNKSNNSNNGDYIQSFDVGISSDDYLFSKQNVLKFECDVSTYATYFRSTSYGDFDYATKKYANPAPYDSSLISEDSINPLGYTADKGDILPPLKEVGASCSMTPMSQA